MRIYKRKAASFLILLGLLLLCQVYGWAEEKAQVQLVSVSPMGGSYISSTPEFTLTFDKNVANIDVRDNNKGKVFFYDQDGNEILSHVSIADDEIYPLQKREIELKLLKALSPGTYKLVVEAGIRAKNGTETGKSYIYYYRVREEESTEESETVIETETESETEELSEENTEISEEESAETSDENITEAPAESSSEAPGEEEAETSPEVVLNNREEEAPSKEKESSKEESKTSTAAATQASGKETPPKETRKTQTAETKEETIEDEKSKKDMVQKKARNQKAEPSSASKEITLYQLVLTENASDSHLKSALQESEDDLPSNDHFIAKTSFRLALTAFILLFFIGFCYRILHFKKDLI